MKLPSWSVPSFPTTLRQLCAVNVVMLALSAGAGWSVASSRGAAVEVARSSSGAAGGSDVMDDARVIFVANVRVAALLVLGACTLGVLTVAVFLWNGYLLGFGLAALYGTQPGNLLYVLAYAPVEFAAFTLASAGSMHLAVRVMRALIAREPLSLRSSTAAFALSLLLLAIGAGIESCLKARVSHPL